MSSLNLDIEEGSIVVLIGPSGCGKTTTLRMINRLIEPTSGRIEINGKDVTQRPVAELRREIGYVIQQVGLFPHQTIAGNIATVPKMLGWEKAADLPIGSMSSQTSWASSRRCWTDIRTSSRVVSSSGWASRGHWPRTRRCC